MAAETLVRKMSEAKNDVVLLHRLYKLFLELQVVMVVARTADMVVKDDFKM